jgi:hypothetical protein
VSLPVGKKPHYDGYFAIFCFAYWMSTKQLTVSQLQDNNAKLKDKIDLIDMRLEEQEQYSRRTSLRFHNVFAISRLVIGTSRTVGSAKKFVRITSGVGGGEFTKTLRKVCTCCINCLNVDFLSNYSRFKGTGMVFPKYL